MLEVDAGGTGGDLVFAAGITGMLTGVCVIATGEWILMKAQADVL